MDEGSPALPAKVAAIWGSVDIRAIRKKLPPPSARRMVTKRKVNEVQLIAIR
jgi:hypothetical protein